MKNSIRHLQQDTTILSKIQKEKTWNIQYFIKKFLTMNP